MALKMQQKLKNCAQCGKIFTSTRGETLCRDCQIKLEEKEREVLDYVREHQGCTIAEVVEAMEVTEKFIKNMINLLRMPLKKEVVIQTLILNCKN